MGIAMRFKSLLTLAEVVFLVVGTTTGLLLLSVHKNWVAVPILVVCSLRVVHRIYMARGAAKRIFQCFRTDPRAWWICVLIGLGVVVLAFVPHGALFLFAALIFAGVYISGLSDSSDVDVSSEDHDEMERIDGTFDYLPYNIFHKLSDGRDDGRI